LAASVHDALDDSEQVEGRARQAILVTVTASPGWRSASRRNSCRRSACAPLTFSR
jgi:hypothetical protein